MVRTSPFHGGNMGSNPVGITNKKTPQSGSFFIGGFNRAEEAIGSESKSLPVKVGKG